MRYDLICLLVLAASEGCAAADDGPVAVAPESARQVAASRPAPASAAVQAPEATLLPFELMRRGLALYSDEEAQMFARRAEQFEADVRAGTRQRPTSLMQTLEAIGIDGRRLGAGGENVGDAMMFYSYQISEGYTIRVVMRFVFGTSSGTLFEGVTIAPQDR